MIQAAPFPVTIRPPRRRARPAASRALDAAVRLLQGRIGRIEVVYVAHLSSLAALSADAIAEVEKDFDEIEQELRGQAAGQLDVSGPPGSSNGAGAASPIS